MKTYKLLFFVTLLASFLMIGFLFFTILDQGVTITHQRDSYELLNKDANIIATVFPRGTNKKELLFLLRKTYTDETITEKKDRILISCLSFQFKENNLLSKVSLQGCNGEEWLELL